MQFESVNPVAGLFGGGEKAVTGAFQAFNASRKMVIETSPSDRPTSAIYSISPGGGDLRVEASGIRFPTGLAIDEYGVPYFTNKGMECRGTRPIVEDPDSLLRLFPNQWYGFPDFTTNLHPANNPRYRPPESIMSKVSWPRISFLIDHGSSGQYFESPEPSVGTLVYQSFPAQSGAEKFAFVPSSGSFNSFRNSVIIALSGDREPFSTSGQKLNMVPGRKLVRSVIDADASKRQMQDFIYNTKGVPASQMENSVEALERPYDVKFGPDGRMYILDYGVMTMKGGREKVTPGTGRVFIVEPAAQQPPK